MFRLAIWIAIRAAVLAGIGLLLYWAFRPRWDFTIVVDGDVVDFRGRFPESRRSSTAQFLQGDFDFDGEVRVSGRWRSDGALELGFRGPISAGDRQRVRNFLLST